MEEKVLWLLLSSVDGIGYKTFNGIVKKLSAEKITLGEFIFDFNTVHYLTQFRMKDKSIKSLIECRKKVQQTEKLVHSLEQKEVYIMLLSDERYPTPLKETFHEYAPPILYMHGNMSLLKNRKVAVVGSRDAMDAHLKTARALAKELSRAGHTIISGYAKGIDTEAHLGVLEAGGSTVMVLSYGIGEFKLKRSFNEMTDDMQDKILVVSEFHPAQKWSVHAAMTRNKTVCALSEAVIVITASADGGTMDTARTALKMGKPLFAAHYDDNSLNSDGNKLLLNEVLSACGNAQAGAHPLNVMFVNDTVRVNINDMEQHLSVDVSHEEKQISLFA